MQRNLSAPEGFDTVIQTFLVDIEASFPEFSDRLPVLPLTEESVDTLFKHCVSVYPKVAFDILSKNEAIFQDAGVFFFPKCNFQDIFHATGVTACTKEAIWNHLRIVLMKVISTVENDTSALFTQENFDSMDFAHMKSSLEEVVMKLTAGLAEIEPGGEVGGEQKETSSDSEEEDDKPFSMKGAEALLNKVSGAMDGTIGKIAKDLAQDITREFDIDDHFTSGSPMNNPMSLISSLFSDPDKIGKIVQSIGSTLQSKMSNGDIDSEQIMKEAADIISNFGEVEGMGNLKNIFNMFNPQAKTRPTSGADIDQPHALVQQDHRDPTLSMKERLKKRLEAKRQAEAAAIAKRILQERESATTNAEVEKWAKELMDEEVSKPSGKDRKG
jgi:hypothetical protein